MAFRETEFLGRCFELLNQNGVLLYNCLGYSEKDCAETERFYHNTFKNAFPSAEIWKLRANYMLVGKKLDDALDALHRVGRVQRGDHQMPDVCRAHCSHRNYARRWT